LCEYLSKKKILLLGHSWGSYLAVEMVQRRPELFAAYIGTGQVGSWRAQVQAQFDFLLDRARAAGDRDRVKQLEAIGTPDPNNAEQYFSWWRIRNPYMSRADAKWFEELRRLYDGMTEEEKRTGAASGEFSMRATLSTILAENLPVTARTLQVPFFVIQGKEDMMTPTSVAVAYFDVVKAPRKKMILIDGAGHFAIVTHSEAFLATLVREVRPIAVKSERR
jgi:pimeloyl-ACP methyl ester carboxylesterase